MVTSGTPPNCWQLSWCLGLWSGSTRPLGSTRWSGSLEMLSCFAGKYACYFCQLEKKKEHLLICSSHSLLLAKLSSLLLPPPSKPPPIYIFSVFCCSDSSVVNLTWHYCCVIIKWQTPWLFSHKGPVCKTFEEARLFLPVITFVVLQVLFLMYLWFLMLHVIFFYQYKKIIDEAKFNTLNSFYS